MLYLSCAFKRPLSYLVILASSELCANVIGLVYHTLTSSSPHLLCFEDTVVWNSVKVEQMLYDSLDSRAG